MADSASTPGSGGDSQSPAPATNGVVETIETNGHVTDSDEEVRARSSRKHAAPNEDEVPELEIDDDDDDAGGLFGSGSEDERAHSPKRRKLSDEELDSGDDVDRRDRIDGDDVDMRSLSDQEKELLVARMDLARHGMPRGSDGELYLLRHPQFMAIEPEAFTPQSFQVPTTGHHGNPPTSAFSAAQVANSTIRWRRDPKNPEKLQSNARIVRWSDGSLTLQLGTSPMDQHELPAKPLAPPQLNPKKPIPTSQFIKSTGYDSRMESHTYLASLHNMSGFVQVTNHLTTSLTVQSVNEEEDEALVRLQEAMNAAVKSNKGADGQGPGVISIKEDPELAKRKAEVAEREKLRAERRRQNQAERERDRTTRVVGRARTGGTGLTAAGLEDEDGMLPSRGKPKSSRKPRRRNSEYSEDEEDHGYRRGNNKEDEYDVDDGFLVGSDEELEVGDASEEEEEFSEADAEGEEEEEIPTKPAQPHEAKADAGDGEDAAGGARNRRRRVVDDEDDE